MLSAGPTREAIEAKDIARYTRALSMLAEGKLDCAEEVFTDLLSSPTITTLRVVSRYHIAPRLHR